MDRVEKEYTIIVEGKEVGKYTSDRYYQEFEKPFFKKFPQYKDVIHWFNHVTCIISDVDLLGYPDFIMKDGERIEIRYKSINFSKIKI